MAQLKDSIVSGNLRVTDEILTNLLQTGILRIPTSSGGTTYGLGTSGQIIKSNGSSVYWADDNNTNYYHSTGSWSGLTYTATANGGAPALAFTIPTGTTSTTVAVGNHTHNYAGSSSSGGAATTARKIVNDTIRPSSPNTAYYDAGLRYYLVSTTMTTDKPLNSDGGILDMQWDNNGGWGTQFYIKHAGTTLTRAAVRSQQGTTWGSWLPVGVFSEATPTSGQIVVTDGTEGGIKSSGYTIATSVPSGAVFTDEKIKQTLNSEDKNYPLIFSKQENSSATSPVTEDVYRNNSIYINPSTGDLTTTNGRITGKLLSELSTGTGTAAQDKGSGQTNRYVPAKWTFNTGKTATDGDIITIKIPVAGHDFGVYMSIDNGTNYYPIVCNSTGRLTTHYPVNNYITVVFEPSGSAASMFPLNGGDARVTVTGGVWRVINYYDSNSNDTGYYLRRIYNNLKAGTNKIFPYTIIMQNADGRWESIVTSSSTASSKTRNAHGFRLGQVLLMYANATYNANAAVGTYNIWSMHSGLIDHRYSFNTENNATKGTTGYKPIYLVGTINSTDGLFYLDETTWWTQTLPSTDDGKIYIYIGDAYDYYRMTFVDTQKFYRYKGGMIREFNQDSSSINGITISGTDTTSKITSWSAGTLPTVGTAIAADDITSWSAGSLPTLGTVISADDITSWDAGALPSLVTKDTTFYPVTSSTTTASKVVSKNTTIYPVTSSTTTASKVVTKTWTIPNVTNKGTTPTLGTAISADDITSWDTGTLPAATYSNGILTFTAGTLPSLSYTSRSIPNVTNVGTTPTLGTAITVTGVSTNTDVTVPILSSSVTITGISTNTDVTVPILSSSVTITEVSSWDAGTLPSLSYTSRSIPNVTGVGTLPSLSYTSRSIPNVTGVGTLPSLSYTSVSVVTP